MGFGCFGCFGECSYVSLRLVFFSNGVRVGEN